uniref:Ig-like domain-containing protein n=1 Tax=Nothobranchius furzeri TaxID=105023 RepID=A0A8C6LA38_NOTFU
MAKRSTRAWTVGFLLRTRWLFLRFQSPSRKTLEHICAQPLMRLEDLQTVEAVKGSVAQLECEVAGTAPFEISWLKNKKPITSDQKYKVIFQDSLSRLEVQTFESADVGDYQCVISNDVGKWTSYRAHLNHQPSQRELKVSPQCWETLSNYKEP